METVTVRTEISDKVRLVLHLSGVWRATPVEGVPAFYGEGETPSEALEDYRRKLEADVSGFERSWLLFRRNGWEAFHRSVVKEATL